MKTDELIDRLGTSLTPVERLARPGVRASRWLGASILYLAVILTVVTVLRSAGGQIDPIFIGSQLLGLVAGALAAWGAFESVIPGRSPWVRSAAVATAFVWLASFIGLAVLSDPPADVSIVQREWICVAMILLGGAPLSVALVLMLRRGAPLNPLLSGMFVALAVGLLANFAACMASPHEDAGVALAWHAATLGALTLFCLIGGRFVLTWKAAIHRQ